jgi:hypothetical protein
MQTHSAKTFSLFLMIKIVNTVLTVCDTQWENCVSYLVLTCMAHLLTIKGTVSRKILRDEGMGP